jgi:hypothetical protein
VLLLKNTTAVWGSRITTEDRFALETMRWAKTGLDALKSKRRPAAGESDGRQMP